MKPTLISAWILGFLLPLSAVAVPQVLPALPATLVKKRTDCSATFCTGTPLLTCLSGCPYPQCCH
ncbi:hypothetical protein M378DRAFT_164795 [Amanita muscaria Koide BX008]|uniref:Uncharacterized protein n=1 Tax=Amanita muscaria (strain Koide BX008) TaxID=946122 RepID=A0A0C2T9C8_AMAMK|nr:hypothetical protein M378DRAFT_164795 [Amanita muscaria Koide BX008]